MENILPEHHLFMGNTYLYGKIVSLLGGNGVRGKKGAGKIMKYMMLSGMLRGKEGGGVSGLLPLMLLGGKNEFMDDLFHEDEEDMTEEEEE